ncbi:unnamed protein product [Rhizophagus irregularis]|nr:unnamed protein product [Rhizophagus irregularis]
MVKSPGTVLLLWLIGGIPKILMNYLFSFMHIFAIRPGIISAVLQSAAQYSWFTINGRRYDEAGIYRLASNWSVSRFNWEHPINGDTNISAYSSSILLIMFSYDGWNTLNYNCPQESISNNNNIVETIAATFFYRLFGKSVVVVRLFTALIVLSVIGTAAAGVWSGSKVIVAAATSDFFPKYSKELRTWNQYFNTPINALLLQFIWCSFIILFVGSSFTITSFTLFSTFSMYSYWIFYFATCIGLLLIRRNKKNELKKKQFDMNDKELNEILAYFQM